jgi:peptide/nickel transport system substrate-binding protein/oligopeptide transport system substrate-binding protein
MVLRADEDTKRLSQAMAHDWQQIGVKVELQAVEWNTFLTIVENEPQPMFNLGWVADYPDPDNFLYVLFNSKQFGSPGNQTWYSNPEVDALTEKARTLTDIKERAPLYEKVEDIVLDEAPWICTYHVKSVICLRKEVKGIRETITGLDTGCEFPNVDFGFVDLE